MGGQRHHQASVGWISHALGQYVDRRPPRGLPRRRRAIPDANETTWFNTAAFGPAPEDRRGNAPVGIIEGPGRHTWDLSFRKKVRLSQRSKVGVQADVFNLFNRVNLNNPSVNFNDAGYGRIASAEPPRQVQIGLRFEF